MLKTYIWKLLLVFRVKKLIMARFKIMAIMALYIIYEISTFSPKFESHLKKWGLGWFEEQCQALKTDKGKMTHFGKF